MATLEGSPIHGGDMFKGPQIKGITSQYSNDVVFITSNYKSNNTTSSRKNLIDLREKYNQQKANGTLDDEIKRHINIIYRAVSWAKENNIENEHLKMKRGKMFRLENNRIFRASYAEIGQSYLNSIEPDMFKLPEGPPDLTFSALTATTGAKNRNDDYTKDFYDKVVSLLLKYAGALKNGNLSCGKCETVFQIVREAIQQNVKPECLKSTDILMPNESAVSQSSLSFSSAHTVPAAEPVVTNMSPMDAPKVEPKETIPGIGYEMIDLSAYFKSNDSIKLEKIIMSKISESSLREEEITSIKGMIKPLLTNLKENQEPLKSLVYILTIYQLEQFYILLKDSFGMFGSSFSNYLTERKQKSLLASNQYKALPGLLETANNNDFKESSVVLTLQQYGNDFGSQIFQKTAQSKARFDDRLRIWEEKPYLYETNYDTNRRTIRDMMFDDINDLLNVKSSVYNSNPQSIIGEASIAPNVTLGGRGSRRRNKKNNKTFKRVRAGKTHKVHKSKRKLTKKK